MRLSLIAIFAVILTCAGAPLKIDGFQQRTWNDGKPSLAPLAREENCPAIPIDFPSRTEIVSTAIDAAIWREATHLCFTFRSAPLPPETILTVFTKDNDSLWRQVRVPCPPLENGAFRLRLPIAGPEAVAAWQPCGHKRPWTSLTAGSLLEFGCIFDLDTGVSTSYQGKILLASIETEKAARAADNDVRKGGNTRYR